MAAGVPRRAAPVPDAAAGERAFRKRQWGGVAPAAPGEMARVHSARRADLEDSSDRPRPKRIKVADNDDHDAKTAMFAAETKMSVDHARGMFKKRLAVELDALRDLVKKAKLLCEPRPEEAKMSVEHAREILKKRVAVELDALRDHVKKAKVVCEPRRPEAPVEAVDKEPSSNQSKMSPLAEQADVRPLSPEEGEIIALPEQDEECIDICGGVSPVAIRDATPLLVSLEVANDTGTSPASSTSSYSRRSSTERRKVDAPQMSSAECKMNVVPEEEEQDEYVDICGGGVSPVVIRSTSSPMVSLEMAGTSPASISSDNSGRSSTESRKKMSPLFDQVDAPQMSAAGCKTNIVLEEQEQGEYVDICGGGVSPVAIRDATPLELTSEACSPSDSDSGSESGSSSSSVSDSGSDSSSSDSCSESETESDSD